MFYQLDELNARQRIAELNKRLEKLYVPIDLSEKAKRGWFISLRQWLANVSIGRTQHQTSAAHSPAAK